MGLATEFLQLVSPDVSCCPGGAAALCSYHDTMTAATQAGTVIADRSPCWLLYIINFLSRSKEDGLDFLLV